MSEFPTFEDNQPEAKIRQAFNEASVNFDFAAHPKIMERLIATGEHFQDAVEMAEIVNSLWEKFPFLQNYPKEKMMLAILLHDIGKSGPAEVSAENPEEALKKLQYAVTSLFPHDSVARLQPDATIYDFAQIAEISDIDDIGNTLEQTLGINIKEEKIRDFWGRHAEWTYDILEKELKDTDNEDVIAIASAHHFIDNRIPNKLKDQSVPISAKMLEVTDKYHAEYQLLTIADKFQASIKRGHNKHEEVIKYLREVVEKSSVKPEMKKTYQEIIDQFESSEVEIKKVLHEN